jgi:predicted  nucleic acid-binding Zn-ribbon protein
VSLEERPEFQALTELEKVIGHMSEELASLRRRAHKAQAEEAKWSAHGNVDDRERIAQLEAENQDLRGRIAQARDRVNELLMRLRFLEEQAAMEATRR